MESEYYRKTEGTVVILLPPLSQIFTDDGRKNKHPFSAPLTALSPNFYEVCGLHFLSYFSTISVTRNSRPDIGIVPRKLLGNKPGSTVFLNDFVQHALGYISKWHFAYRSCTV